MVYAFRHLAAKPGTELSSWTMQHARMKTSSIKNSPEILLEDQRTVGGEQILGQADVLSVVAAKGAVEEATHMQGGARCVVVFVDNDAARYCLIKGCNPSRTSRWRVSAGTVRVHGWIFRSMCRHHHLFCFFSSSPHPPPLETSSVWQCPNCECLARTDVHCCTCTQHVLLPIVLGSVGSVKNLSGARLLCWCFFSSSVQQRRRVLVFCFHWVPPLSVRLLPH